MKIEKENMELTDFVWDEDIEFFKDDDTSNTIDKTEEIVKLETDKPVTEAETVKENDDKEIEKEPDFDFETITPNSEQATEKTNDNRYKTVVSTLKDKGFFSTDIDIEDIQDEDDFILLQENEINARVEKGISSFADTLNEEGKLFIKYVKNGGKPIDFFNVLKETNEIPIYNDEDDLINNIKVVKYYLKHVKDLEDDDIDDTINLLKENNTINKYASKYSTQLEGLKEKREKLELERLDAINNQAKENKKQFETTISSFIDTNDTVSKLRLDKKEKELIKDYIFKPNKKRENNTYVSKFTEDLQEIFKDPEKLVTLAKLMRTNFNLDVLTKELETKIVNETKEKINKYTKPKETKTSLADFFSN